MKVAQVVPCLKCRRSTRPPRALAGDYPGTVPRVGDMCKTCNEGRTSALNPEARMPVEEIRAGLESFLRRRRDREDMMVRREMYLCHPNRARKQVNA